MIAGLPRAVHVAAPATERGSGVVVFGIIGEIQTPYATGAGKLWLAEQSDADVETYLRDTRLERLGTNTIIDADGLCAEIAQVREQGFAMNRMEDNTSVIAVAVPIRDLSDAFVGSISLVRPAHAVTDAVEAEMLRQARRGSELLSRHLPSCARGSAEPSAESEPPGSRREPGGLRLRRSDQGATDQSSTLIVDSRSCTCGTKPRTRLFATIVSSPRQTGMMGTSSLRNRAIWW